MNIDTSSSSSEFHRGVVYGQYLKQIHRAWKPRSYLEVGVETGKTLAFAECPAVAVDPEFRLQGEWLSGRQQTHLFQMKSDDFFARYDLRAFFPDGVDFAFLDGLHHFEVLLRDFLNTEKYSHGDTVIALHDCYPVNCEIASREANHDNRVDVATREWWTGDVWKLLPILRDFRPDLRVAVLDCPPTGLVAVQGLDPNSKVILEQYEEIVAKYGGVTLETFGIERFRAEFPTTDSCVFHADALKEIGRT
jgi:hypothetical protein